MNPAKPNFQKAFEHPVNTPVIEALRRIRHIISPLPLHRQESRSSNFSEPEADFLGAISGSGRDFYNGIPFEESISMDSIVDFARLQNLFAYPSSLEDADLRDTLGCISKQLSSCLEAFPGFFLREQVLNSAPLSNSEHLPVAFALLVRQYGSTPERKWRWRRGCHDTALFDQNQAIALAMRISPTHPAAILGVIVRDPRAPPSRPVRAVWKPGSCDSPSSRSSRAVSRLSPPHVGAAPETAGRTTSAAALAGRFRTAHHTRQRRDRCGALSSRGGRALAAAASESAARKKLSLRMEKYHRAWAWS